MSNTILAESTATAPVKKSGRWLVNIAVPGQGTTGKYSAAMLAEYGPKAFPPGTKSYFKHNKPEDRDPRDQIGVLKEGAFWNPDEQKLQGYLDPFARWNPLLEEMGEQAELSMYVMDWEKDSEGNITRLGPHRANSIDAVAFGGLAGSGLKEQLFESLVETAIAGFDATPGVTSAQENKDKMTTEEKLDTIISKLALVESFIAESKATATDKVQAKVDAEAIATAVSESVESYDAKVALIESATDLLPSQRADLRAAAKKGEEIAPLLESAKKTVEEFKAALTESAAATSGYGRVVGSTSSNEDWTVSGVTF